MDAEEFMDHVTDGGGELTGYYKKDTLVKIVEWIGASFGNRTREFYFKGRKLFFAFEKFESFVEKDNGELDLSKTSTTYEARYYFNSGKLIDKKITGKAGIADVATNSNAIVVAANQNISFLKGKK